MTDLATRPLASGGHDADAGGMWWAVYRVLRAILRDWWDA